MEAIVFIFRNKRGFENWRTSLGYSPVFGGIFSHVGLLDGNREKAKTIFDDKYAVNFETIMVS